MPSLADLPLEVIIDNLLPLLPLKDIISLATTNSEYAAICSDDTFWKRKLKEDYNFADASSARTKGYKFLYKGVHNAKPYVWGSTGEGRLGLSSIPQRRGIRMGSVPFPTELNVSGPRIVELAAGGWSFHALDAEGSIRVWGQLEGHHIGGLHIDPFSERTKRADTPTKLILPERITKIGCGRAHATALSSHNCVWVFTSWGRPYVLTTPLLSTSNAFSTPAQVESGWSFSAVLTNGGEVYMWWPLGGDFGELNREHDEACDAADMIDPEKRVRHGENGVECQTWEVGKDPWLILPVATVLPRLRADEEAERIVKIAAGDDYLIGLTEGGHVLKVDFEDGESSFNNPLRRPRWKYLERFSEIEHVRSHPTFDKNNPEAHPAPETLTITHVSANFLTFFAYSTGSSSIILEGSKGTTPASEPSVPLALQYKDVISVILGDYHFGALTATGKLLTWGAFSSGALGLGDPTKVDVGRPGGYATDGERQRAERASIVPPRVEVPEEVRFGTDCGRGGKKSFVFGAAAGGWHTGALVIDLEDGGEKGKGKGKGKEKEVEKEWLSAEEDALERSQRQHELQSVAMPGGWGGQMPFRVGLAGARGRIRRVWRGGAGRGDL